MQFHCPDELSKMFRMKANQARVESEDKFKSKLTLKGLERLAIEKTFNLTY